MNDDTIALICFGTMIAALEGSALYLGFNGQILMLSFGTITGLFGMYLGRKTKK